MYARRGGDDAVDGDGDAEKGGPHEPHGVEPEVGVVNGDALAVVVPNRVQRLLAAHFLGPRRAQDCPSGCCADADVDVDADVSADADVGAGGRADVSGGAVDASGGGDVSGGRSIVLPCIGDRLSGAIVRKSEVSMR